MTERAYVTVDRAESPRIIEVAAPLSGSNEITIQDLHDTLNSNTLPAGDADDSLDNMDDEALIDSAGKEQLGGGVKVGITATLQNAQVAFEGNYSPAETGSVLIGDVNGQLLNDGSATFITNGVRRGAIVINWSDRSAAEVLEVQAENLMRTRPLQLGVLNQYSPGDLYSVFNIIQKEVSGGNLVAVDTDGVTPISPLFPTFCTQIVRTSSSSATLQEQQDIQYSSFGGGVTVDVINGSAGTTYPKGTPRDPVNNLADAVVIANSRGFTTLFIKESMTLGVDATIDDFHIVGDSASHVAITIDAAASVTNCTFSNATIEGVLDGANGLSGCVINNLNFLDGIVEQCVLQGVIVLSTQDVAHFLDCWSGIPGQATPKIDFAGAGSQLTMRNYNGGINLQNKSGPESVSVDLNSGQVIVEDSVTAGTLVLRGTGKWANKDTYAGGANVIDELLSAKNIVLELNQTLYDGKTYAELQAVMLAMAQGRIRENPPNSGQFEFYSQDNTTILYRLNKTATERQRV